MANYDRLIEIDELIKNRYSDNVVLDGIVNFDKFIATKPKILWILKEANITTPESTYKNGVFYLNDYLNEDVKQYSNWKKTWELVMEISDAVIHDAQNWQKEVPCIERLLQEEIIKKIAAINIKKIGGNAASVQKTINSFYQKDKDIIMAQIEAIAPDIIINCSRVNALFNDLKIEESKQVSQFDVVRFKNGVIINGYHPAQSNLSHKRYFELIRDCIKVIS